MMDDTGFAVRATEDGTGPALWRKAKHLVPGGSLLSKRSERFLPDLWPSYFSRASGCEVWDLDGLRYWDFAQMGVGSCVLGYADPDVNDAVIRVVQAGSMATLNTPLEVKLAERLVGLHPWAQKVRFARTGGEACAMAIRIARAATGRSRIAFSGYHGWHDWYLSANLAAAGNLDGQLLPGLEPKGVPRELTDTALPFNYNVPDELERWFDSFSDIGAVIMEPRRSMPPEPGFLERVKELTHEAGAVLIFDEITSGLRINVGGIHMTYGVEPDVAVLGKALGNGFPISAVIGRDTVMDAAEETFISSTFWTESVGFAAALATLDKMETLNVPQQLVGWGERINQGWSASAAEYGLTIEISGIPPLTHLSFLDGNDLEVMTLFAQEMLERGYLAGAAVYATAAYSEKTVDGYLSAVDEVFGMIREALAAGDVRSRLRGRVIEPGFGRLT